VHLDLPAACSTASSPTPRCSTCRRAALPKVLALVRGAQTRRRAVQLQPARQQRGGLERPRYGSYHDLHRGSNFMTAAGFTHVHHYYRPAGLPREQQPWLASVWRKHRFKETVR
jgi:hypothetical protein